MNALPSPHLSPCPRPQVFDLRDGSAVGSVKVADDTVTGCSINPHPALPLLATASGQRRYPLAPSDDEGTSDGDEDGEGEEGQGERQRGQVSTSARGAWLLPGMCNALRVWRLHSEWVVVEAAAEQQAGAQQQPGAEGAMDAEGAGTQAEASPG